MQTNARSQGLALIEVSLYLYLNNRLLNYRTFIEHSLVISHDDNDNDSQQARRTVRVCYNNRPTFHAVHARVNCTL